MKSYLPYPAFFFFFIFSGFTCCPSIEQAAISTNVKIERVNAWLNLMPGSNSKFHLTGEVIIESKIPLNVVKSIFQSIKVLQNDIELYSFAPKINLLSETKGTGNHISYRIEFLSENGLKYNNRTVDGSNINIEIVFNDEFEKENIIINDIKLEKAY
jgi:hypothetical protein